MSLVNLTEKDSEMDHHAKRCMGPLGAISAVLDDAVLHSVPMQSNATYFDPEMMNRYGTIYCYGIYWLPDACMHAALRWTREAICYSLGPGEKVEFGPYA